MAHSPQERLMQCAMRPPVKLISFVLASNRAPSALGATEIFACFARDGDDGSAADPEEAGGAILGRGGTKQRK